MKKTLLIALGMICCGVLAGVVLATVPIHTSEAVASRPGAVSAADAGSYIGRSITVEGVVSEVHIAERAIFIDIGGRYPDQKFTGVVFAQDSHAFPDLRELEGTTVDISGVVRIYRGRPEIILRSADQIRRR